MVHKILDRIRSSISKEDLLRIFFGAFSLFLLFMISKLALRGGVLPTTLRNILLFSMMILVLNMSRKAFWIFAFPFVLLYAIYLPIGINFGPPSYQYFASVLATDGNEAKEFFQQIPIKYYLYSVFMVGGIILFRILTTRFDLRFAENKTVMIVLVIIVMLPQAPLKYPKQVYWSSVKVIEDMQELKKLQKKSEWEVENVHSEYDTYVLVIGESARKDYYGVYGYPIENTPFMSSTKGVIVDGLTSGGINTVASLRLMFTHSKTPNWQPRYEASFVDLANSADIETIWISNQGFFGTFDTPITAIAEKSKIKRFIKKEAYNSKNTDDLVLLSPFKTFLEKKTKKTRLIILHLYGSHPYICDRLHGFTPNYTVDNQYYRDIACYVTSIHKTDHFLQQVKEALDQYANTFDKRYSMIYFSDHGLAHRELDGRMTINNNFAVKQHYDIPLIKISSDDTERVVIKRQKSGLNFTKGLAHWMGIEAAQIPEAYDLFSDEDDEDDYGLSERLEKLKDDPAIDIREL